MRDLFLALSHSCCRFPLIHMPGSTLISSPAGRKLHLQAIQMGGDVSFRPPKCQMHLFDWQKKIKGP